MNLKLVFIPILGLLLLNGCQSDPEQKKSDFKIMTDAKKNVFKSGDPLNLTLVNKKNRKIDSVLYTINDEPIENGKTLTDQKLGKQGIEATIYSEGEIQKTTETITILNNFSPNVLQFEILNTYPHDINSYTQGLEFYDGMLYESTGQTGKSKLRKIDYVSGKVIENIDLANDYFGEGLTVMNGKIYQLTWQSRMGFIYDIDTFKRTGSFKYGASKEGWGLCHDNDMIYKSDGTEKIWLLDPQSMKETGYIQAYTNKGKIVGLNELEWVNGRIYANRYQKNGVAIINPKNGAIEAVIDFSPLRDLVKKHPKLDVLNGIAYNPQTQSLFVTGKNWNKLFEVKILEN
ncbi:MAG: glutaminyl-peptide cyclotransferase [Flavobacteriaceae bacterium]|nr:glutaminyl-peptide cyclotransferase [Bacteroidia bacterium]NNF74743.1 glutaminyl-peptide cyclotransferase [Flavobacteriaceae bacterium]NNK73004.1 glutaminyl-peptide cyclotransferase [Flavobacteriaceae bacterium]